MVRSVQYTVNTVSGASEKPGELTATSRCGNAKKFFKRLYNLLSSAFGLVILLTAYSFIGAVVFQAVEEPNELEKLKERENAVTKAADLIVNWTREAASLEDEEITSFFVAKFRDFEEEITALVANSTGNVRQYREWDLWGSLFFCVTVYTTIGYGHIAPVTLFGRVVCVVYALIGIPLCLVFLASLGLLLTQALKFLWSFIRRFYYTGSCRRIRKSVPNRAKAFRHSVENKLDDRTHRSGSITVRRRPCCSRFWSACCKFFLCRKSSAEKDSDHETENQLSRVENGGLDNLGLDLAESFNTNHSPQSSLDNAERKSDAKNVSVDEKFNLPPLVGIVIVCMYTLFGAAMYTIWEEWNFHDSFYFIFISVSTIGFGDVLPGRPKYFLASSIYIIIGLALVAMVINVIVLAVRDAIHKAKKKAIHTIDKARDHLEDQIDQVKGTIDKARDKVFDVSARVREGINFAQANLDKFIQEEMEQNQRNDVPADAIVPL